MRKKLAGIVVGLMCAIGLFACGSSTEDTKEDTLVSIDLTPVDQSILIDATQQFTATGTHSKNPEEDLTGSVTWSSSNTAVATISNAGLATAIAMGTTTITALLEEDDLSGTTILTSGQTYPINVNVTGSDIHVTDVQVCASHGSGTNSTCGPEGGFAIGLAGTISAIGVTDAAYTVSIPGNQSAATYCTITSGASGTFGTSMPTVVVNCT